MGETTTATLISAMVTINIWFIAVRLITKAILRKIKK